MIASLRYNIHFIAEHIYGLLNTSADISSRLQIQQFKDQYPKWTGNLRWSHQISFIFNDHS